MDEGPAKAPAPSAQALIDTAREWGEAEVLESAGRIVSLQQRLGKASQPPEPKALLSLAHDAGKEPSCQFIRQHALRVARHELDSIRENANYSTLQVLRDCARKNEEEEFAREAEKVLERLDKLTARIQTGDPEEMAGAVREAREAGCGATARDGHAALMQLVEELGSSKRVSQRVGQLQKVHSAAARNGLQDVADKAEEIYGKSFPSDWHMQKDGLGSMGVSSTLNKIPSKEKQLLDKMQRLVNETYKSWGFLGKKDGGYCSTRDRKHDTNPLATSLIVEAVVHVENAEMYLNYMARRETVQNEFKAKPIKSPEWRHPETRRVSVLGGRDPVDYSFNECWLWHGCSEAAASGITDSAFDLAKAGNGLFGRGLYFGESCMKADEYTGTDARGLCPLLLCRVLLGRGNYCNAKDPIAIRAELENSCVPAKGGDFHSVIGDREPIRGTFREFVIFNDDQVLPEYIVWYRRKGPMRKPS
jgi:hypothetical protein